MAAERHSAAHLAASQLEVVQARSDVCNELDAWSGRGLRKSWCSSGSRRFTGWQARCRLLFALPKEKSSISSKSAGPCRRRSRRSLRNRQDDPRGRRAAAPLRCDRACPADLRAATATSSRRRRRQEHRARGVSDRHEARLLVTDCAPPGGGACAVVRWRYVRRGRSARAGIQAGRAAHRRQGPFRRLEPGAPVSVR